LYRFCRLWTLLCAGGLALGAAAASEPPSSWQPIFNGSDLSGWIVDGRADYLDGELRRPVWTAANGEILCAGRGFGFLRYERELGDFALRLEYRLAPKGNSGVGLRGPVFTGPAATRPSLAGYEIQLLDDSGKPPTDRSTGSLYRYLAPTENAARRAGEWNALEVECRGPRIRVTLNGRLIQDVDQSRHEALAGKPLRGFVSLQNHGSPAAFRAIELRDLGRPEESGESGP
jgi:hypothetical protein